jgi:hypothetical protein
MKKLLGLILFLAIYLVIFFMWWNRIAPFDSHPAPIERDFVSIESTDKTVTISGMAHYALHASQTWPAGLLRHEQTLWFYPLMPPGDGQSKRVTIMIAGLEEPERGIDLEDLTVTGWVRPPRARIGVDLEAAFREQGYIFEGDYILIEQLE